MSSVNHQGAFDHYAVRSRKKREKKWCRPAATSLLFDQNKTLSSSVCTHVLDRNGCECGKRQQLLELCFLCAGEASFRAECERGGDRKRRALEEKCTGLEARQVFERGCSEARHKTETWPFLLLKTKEPFSLTNSLFSLHPPLLPLCVSRPRRDSCTLWMFFKHFVLFNSLTWFLPEGLSFFVNLGQHECVKYAEDGITGSEAEVGLFFYSFFGRNLHCNGSWFF